MENSLKINNSKLDFSKKLKTKNTLIILFLFFLLGSISKINAQRTKLKVGDRVPYFSLLDQDGNEFNTKKFIGIKPMVLFFYPKDNAPVCEAQVCSFRDNYSKFEDLNAVVVGINPGYLVTHRDFSRSNKLQFPLLADKYSQIQKMFGVPNLFFSTNPKRYTFIIDKYGIIKNIYYSRKVNVNKHVEESLITLKIEEYINKELSENQDVN